MNREDLRQKKRDEAVCTTDSVNPIPPQVCEVKPRRDRKRSGDCDAPEVCTPDQFTPIPAPETPPASLIPIPEGLVVGNEELNKICTDVEEYGPTGDSVVVVAGTFTRTFLWTDILDLTDSQRSFIDGLQGTDESWTSTVLEGSINELTTLFKITTSQAAKVREIVDTFKEEVTTEADSFALSQLDCYWLNTKQVATCPVGTVNSGEGVVATATVEAGVIVSYDSQQDANDVALTQATSELRCAVGNIEKTRTCMDLGLEAVPNDAAPAYLGADLRIGSVTVAAGTVLIFVSGTAAPAEIYSASVSANAQAVELAESRLDCFYFSPEVARDCQDIDTDYTFVNAANPDSGKSGQTVLLPAGFFTSTLSSSDALAQAELYADALLDCFYANSFVQETCGTYDPNNTTTEIESEIFAIVETTVEGVATSVYLPLNLGKSFSVASVAAGQFVSFSSKNEADEQATAFARAQLRCVYCNTEITKKCIGTEDETKGISAGSICSQFANEIYEIATAIAEFKVNTSVATDADCNFYSAAVEDSCPNDPDISENSFPKPGTSVTLAKGAVTLTYEQTGASSFEEAQNYVDAIAQAQAESLLNCFYENDLVQVDCTTLSKSMIGLHPNATSEAEVTPGIFISYSSKEEANANAESFAKSQLNCFYGNVEVEVDCDTLGKPTVGLHPDAEGGPLTVDPNEFISYAGEAEATALARLIAIAQLSCFYGNDAVEAECPGESSPANPVAGAVYTVKVGGSKEPPAVDSFISFTSRADATTTAQLFAESLLYCVYTNDTITRTCSDIGLDGATVGDPTSVTVTSGTTFSGTDAASATLTATLLAEGQLVCLFGNTPQVGKDCPEGTEMIGEIGSVGANTFISPVSQEAVDSPAKALAEALTVCVDGAIFNLTVVNNDVEIEDCSSNPFGIAINGSTSEDEEGIVTQSSSFDVTVCDGNACYPSGETEVTGFYGNKSAPGLYRVYGKVSIPATNRGPGNPTNGFVVVEDASASGTIGSNVRYYMEGSNYIFLFLIGTIVAAERGDGYSITVTQTQVGDYSYYGSCGDDGGGTSDGNGVNTHGGPREVILCVDGKPYVTTIETTKLIELPD